MRTPSKVLMARGMQSSAGSLFSILCVTIAMIGSPCSAAAENRVNKELARAARAGELSVVKQCLDKGADANSRDDLGYTALHWACRWGHTDVVRLLLSRGADVTAEPSGENFRRVWLMLPVWKRGTPLHLACAAGHADVVKLLLSKGADVNAKYSLDGATPLHSACRSTLSAAFHREESIPPQRLAEVVKLLLREGADVSARDHDGNTPLHAACYWCQKDAANLLLGSGADVNARDNDGETPLHEACFEGNGEIVKLLLAQGADVNAVNRRRERPLDHACAGTREAMVRFLLANGAHVASTGREGKVSSHVVSAACCTAITEALLTNDLDAGAKQTILYLAALIGQLDVVRLLARHGADINRKAQIGFRELWKDVDESSGTAPRLGPLWAARLNWALCCDGRDFYTKGGTALHWASLVGWAKVVEFLLSNGADATAVDEERHTALHLAAAVNSPDVVRVLIASGANINAKDKSGTTALGWALRTGSRFRALKGGDLDKRTRRACVRSGGFSEPDYREVVKLLEASSRKQELRQTTAPSFSESHP